MPTVRRPGVPEPQADVQAELMAEAFGFYAENILTKDHFEAVLDAKLDARFAEQDTKFEKRFAEQDVRFNKIELGIDTLEERIDRLGGCVEKLTALTVKVERTQFVHTWTLGVGVAALLVPQLNSMFG